MMNLSGTPVHTQPRNVVPSAFLDASSVPSGKTKMCSKYKTPEGCRFGDKRHVAHGEWELGWPSIASDEDPRIMGSMSGEIEPLPLGLGATVTFGASAIAKISIDASLAGAIIGKGRTNSKQVCRVTGVKLSIRGHESDPNLRNIELEGTFDQIKQASSMVQELIMNVKAASGLPYAKLTARSGGASNYKTKLCENFAKGSCTFGERCHFAHGAEELRNTAM